MSAGILLPAAGRLIEPYTLLWLGALLFLNLLRLSSSDLIEVFKTPRQLVVLSIIKLVVLPVGMYALAYVVYEPFALPILLLSGISTGLGAVLSSLIECSFLASSSVIRSRLRSSGITLNNFHSFTFLAVSGLLSVFSECQSKIFCPQYSKTAQAYVTVLK
jgi:hypothetical protein